MHPYHYHGWHRGPSRILWFFIGAVSATWWIKRKDCDNRVFGHCRRPALPVPTPDDAPPSSQSPSPAQYPRTGIPSGPSTPGWGGGPSWESYKWDQEREHLSKISRQAADAMTDLTEATLESVLTTAEALKVKLAEHRAQREKQQAAIEKQLEDDRKNPPHLI